MSNNKKGKVYVVEDDSHYQSLYQATLNNDFELYSYTTAQDALTHIKDERPNVVILDLHLPDLDGFEFCERLRQMHYPMADLDIIFVSGEPDLAMKVKAFEVGASDYLLKPFIPQVLTIKIASEIERQMENRALRESSKETEQLVFSSMAQAAHYRQIMTFYKDLNACRDTGEVAEAFFSLMSSFGLNTSICFRLPELSFYRQDHSLISPIEEEIYSMLWNRGRLFEFSKRLLVNDQHVSFLIKNLPECEHELGQIRDYTASLVEVLEAKLRELFTVGSLDKLVTDLASNVADLSNGVHEHRELVNDVLANMIVEISASFHSLDMTEEQELFFNRLIERGKSQLEQADGKISHVVESLTALHTKSATVQKVLNESNQDKPSESTPILF